MLGKIRRNFYMLPYCIEAVLDLAICKFFILFLPFSFYAKKYGIAHCESFYENMTFARHKIKLVQKILQKVPSLLPWKSKCLDQAMAAQRMLKRRGLQTTLYFGVKKDVQKNMIAHAWIRCGDCWVIGYQPSMNYVIVGVYANGIECTKK